ncbi:hypothetical protein ANTRET_LOCUS3670, partial [Anthophora retusa]
MISQWGARLRIVPRRRRSSPVVSRLAIFKRSLRQNLVASHSEPRIEQRVRSLSPAPPTVVRRASPSLSATFNFSQGRCGLAVGAETASQAAKDRKSASATDY